MSYTYETRKRVPGAGESEKQGKGAENAVPNSAHLAALTAGSAAPSAEDKGRSVALGDAIRAKMEQSFGTDFSGVRLYESQTVADAGAEAVARGNEIAFAPGKTDFSTRAGQELLGHELSHVTARRRGEVTGGGFLENSALESRADYEGARAAAGQQVYGGATAPISAASAGAMAGPMQARKPTDEEREQYEEEFNDEVDRQREIDEHGMIANTGKYGEGIDLRQFVNEREQGVRDQFDAWKQETLDDANDPSKHEDVDLDLSIERKKFYENAPTSEQLEQEYDNEEWQGKRNQARRKGMIEALTNDKKRKAARTSYSDNFFDKLFASGQKESWMKAKAKYTHMNDEDLTTEYNKILTKADENRDKITKKVKKDDDALAEKKFFNYKKKILNRNGIKTRFKTKKKINQLWNNGFSHIKNPYKYE